MLGVGVGVIVAVALMLTPGLRDPLAVGVIDAVMLHRQVTREERIQKHNTSLHRLVANVFSRLVIRVLHAVQQLNKAHLLLGVMLLVAVRLPETEAVLERVGEGVADRDTGVCVALGDGLMLMVELGLG